MADYAGIVGHLLAEATPRISGASTIAGYTGQSDKLDRAVAQHGSGQPDSRSSELVPAARCSTPT